MTQTQPYAPRHHRQRKESPLGLLIAVIQERLSLSEREHRAAFKRLVLADGYEEFIGQIIDEWQGIKYSTALRAAQPLSVGEVKDAAARRVQERKQDAERVATAKDIIGARLLDLVMPNGKALRDCTGGDCIRFGGLYTRIGKKVGESRVVGKVLSAAGMTSLLKAK